MHNILRLSLKKSFILEEFDEKNVKVFTVRIGYCCVFEFCRFYLYYANCTAKGLSLLPYRNATSIPKLGPQMSPKMSWNALLKLDRLWNNTPLKWKVLIKQPVSNEYRSIYNDCRERFANASTTLRHGCPYTTQWYFIINCIKNHYNFGMFSG